MNLGQDDTNAFTFVELVECALWTDTVLRVEGAPALLRAAGSGSGSSDYSLYIPFIFTLRCSTIVMH